MPLIMLMALFFVLLGIRAVKTKQVGARAVDRILYGKKEFTGRWATFIGASYVVAGSLLILACLVMMVLGRTLLPK